MNLVQTLAGVSPLRLVRVDDSAASLARLAAGGDRRAFSALMRAHKESLYRFVRRRTSDPEEAYDIVQEAFVSAWSAMGRYDPDRPFAAWLRSIAINKCRDRARRAAVRRSFSAPCPAGAAETMRNEAASPEQDLIARDELARLSHALETLPAHLREALVLTAVDGLPQAAAAAILGCSIKAVEYRVHRAREMLAEALAADEDG